MCLALTALQPGSAFTLFCDCDIIYSWKEHFLGVGTNFVVSYINSELEILVSSSVPAKATANIFLLLLLLRTFE